MSHVSSAAPTTVNLMVVYSRDAEAAVTNIDEQVDAAVAQNNLYFQNSAVDIRFNLVHKGVINHEEIDSLPTVLQRMKHPSDGYLDDIFALRQEYQADLVCLVTRRGIDDAWAFIMSTPHAGFRNQSFAAIRADRLSDHITFAHELGHTMGLNHAKGYTSGPQCYSYSVAHNFTANGITYGTIGSYVTPHAPYFGNPDVLFNGVPTGSAVENNARTLNENAAIVSQFRFPPPPAPTNDTFAERALLNGEALTVTANNESATKEASEPAHVSDGADYNSAWWTRTAPRSAEVTIGTFGSDFDTCLAVYTNTTLPDLRVVARNNNSPGGLFNSQAASMVAFQAVAGRSYQIAVAGIERDVGNIVLTLQMEGASIPPAVAPRLEARAERETGEVQISITGPPAHVYEVEEAMTPGQWAPFLTVTNQTGSVQFTQPGTNSTRFYRARVVE